MTQDPNAEAQIGPSEVGANAAETGERDLASEGSSHDAFEGHEARHEHLDFHAVAEHGHVASALDPDAPAVLSVEVQTLR